MPCPCCGYDAEPIFTGQHKFMILPPEAWAALEAAREPSQLQIEIKKLQDMAPAFEGTNRRARRAAAAQARRR